MQEYIFGQNVQFYDLLSSVKNIDLFVVLGPLWHLLISNPNPIYQPLC